MNSLEEINMFYIKLLIVIAFFGLALIEGIYFIDYLFDFF